MGKAELVTAWNTVKTELDTLPDDFDKLDLLKTAKAYIDAKQKSVKAAMSSVAPSNISEVPSALIRIEIEGKWYELNTSTGALSPKQGDRMEQEQLVKLTQAWQHVMMVAASAPVAKQVHAQVENEMNMLGLEICILKKEEEVKD